MGFKEKIKITMRGFKLLHRLVPGLILFSSLYRILDALLPFITIYMSGRILTALAEKATLKELLFLAGITVLLNLAVNLIKSLMGRGEQYFHQVLWNVCETPLYEKIRQMDYEKAEDAAVYERLQKIELLRFTNGLGLPRLYWCLSEGISGVFTVAFSIALTAGAFLSRPVNPPEYLAFLFSPWCTLLIIALILLKVGADMYRVTALTRAMGKNMGEFADSNRIAMYYMDYIQNYKAGKDLKLYHMKGMLKQEIDSRMDFIVSARKKYQQIEAKYECLGVFCTTAFDALIYGYTALKALFGSFGVGSIVQYAGAISRFGMGVSTVMENAAMFLVNAEPLKELFDFLDIPDKKYKGSLSVEKRSDHEYEIEFCDVSFRYPGTEQNVLNHLNLKFRIGQKLAVVGMNGSGKTTMIKLLCRLYDPTEGKITLNGIDIKKYSYDEYLNLFSVVFQDFKLFSFTMAENVAAGTEFDEEKVIKYLEKVGLGERLARCPKGILTPIYKDFEEEGVEISGGEAQKIAMARALYREAPFIILDEPTAALDPISEFEVYSRFNEIVEEKTAVYISHRLSSCRFCDDIAVFDRGRLIQRGSHEELLKAEEGMYFELWNAQAQYYQLML